MKLKDIWIVLPMAFALAACGKSSDSTEPLQNPGSGSALSGGSNPTPAGGTPNPVGPTGASGASGTTGGTTGPTGGVDVNGCPQYPSRSWYQYYVSGSGNVTRSTTYNDIVADSKLRVSIEPIAISNSADTAANRNTTRMAVDVTLLRNGVPVGTLTVPTQNAGTTGYTTGTLIGKKSNPTIADFSAMLSGNARYSIRINQIKSDTRCNQFCNVQNAQAYCYYHYGAGFQSTCAYTWNWDYHHQKWACCGTDYLQQCQQLQCGVSPVLEEYNWSMYVRVETDSTSCITGPFAQ